jgi:pyruvate,water dikinase
MTDLAEVGGKNASLGEMLGSLADAGIRVPEGFATTARAFEEFLAADGLGERIATRLKTLDPGRRGQLGEVRRRDPRVDRGKRRCPSGRGRDTVLLSGAYKQCSGEISFAVRSSATAEDLPDSSVRRPAGDLPQHPRRGEGAGSDPQGLRLALQRPRDLVPGAPRLRGTAR